MTPSHLSPGDSSAVPESPTHAALHAGASLVCKQGVSIGLLSPPDLQRALALAWSCLPQNAGCSEAEVNGMLRRVLDGPGRFLRTDHVELRRWLVDTGWLVRDGVRQQAQLTAHQRRTAWATRHPSP
ncbi:MAG: DUF2087 domain-containing protein [Rubrivivax sp.]